MSRKANFDISPSAGVQVEGRGLDETSRSRFTPRPLRPVFPPSSSGDAVAAPAEQAALDSGIVPVPEHEPVRQSKHRTLDQIRSQDTTPREKPYDGKVRAERMNMREFATDPSRFKGEETVMPDGPLLKGEAPRKGDPFAVAQQQFRDSKGKPSATPADLAARRAGTTASAPPPVLPPTPPAPPSPPVLPSPTAGRWIAPVSDTVQAGWTRVQVSSGCIPYPWNDIKVRVFGLDDLASLFAAIKAKSYTMFLDALDPAIDCDIRELTGRDLRELMYWWRQHSYQRSPYTLNWTSRYGNKNSSSIFNQSQIETTFLQMTPEQHAAFVADGIDFPRVRDAEYLGDLELSDADMWKAERAQFVVDDSGAPLDENWYPRRIARLNEGGIAMLERIREFKELSNHGPVERITVSDSEFQPAAAALKLRAMAEDLTRMLEQVSGDVDPDIIIGYTTQVSDYLTEADDITDKIEQATEARETDEALARQMMASIKPREETKVLNISALDFFPAL